MYEKQLFIQKLEKEIKTCAFTGHRELGERFSKSKLKKEIESLIQKGVEIFYNGMAVGFDLLAAETVLSLKKKYPFIKLVACIPCYNQEKNYREKDKKRYAKIHRQLDEYVMTSDVYYKGCMLTRDRYMADRADVLLAYCVKETGGAAYTVRYFTNKYPEKEVIFL